MGLSTLNQIQLNPSEFWFSGTQLVLENVSSSQVKTGSRGAAAGGPGTPCWNYFTGVCTLLLVGADQRSE